MTVNHRLIEILRNIHSPEMCEGRPCVIHNISDHHMADWPIEWRDDRGIVERKCSHGIGHPDPDQFWFWKSTDQMYQAVHGCDGCCTPPARLSRSGRFRRMLRGKRPAPQ